MKKVVLVYDDTVLVNDSIKTIIGKNSFGEIILKRKKLFKYVSDIASKKDIEFIKINDFINFDKKIGYENKVIYFHLLSNAAINDEKDFELILEKLKYVKDITIVKDDIVYGIVFTSRDEYIKFIKKYEDYHDLNFENYQNVINAHCFLNIADYNNLLTFISSGFDSRYFNSLKGNKYSITKQSNDKNKMNMEYSYYWLIPDEMKSWMVMPYDYQERENYASYKMERMPMVDVAIRWTHSAIDTNEFIKLLDKLFRFFEIRSVKKVSIEDYKKVVKSLYIDKVLDRLEKLKKCDFFPQLNSYISIGTDFNSIDDIFNYYLKLLNNYLNKIKLKNNLVIGHGDVFFANILYSKEIDLLRLIDPKGALKESDLWTDPYYDVAKLSHSICGNYDFFNVDIYDISINQNMKFELDINFDNRVYKEIFKEKLSQKGYDYNLVRLYEASLFLSMLPLHIDNKRKVLGFVLNAINILKEIEKNV